MMGIERFNDLDDVRALRLRLKGERDARATDLRQHWERLQDRDYRRGLMLDAASDLFRSKNGNGALGAVAGGLKLAAGWLPVLGPLMGARKGLLGSRLLWTGIGIALPLLLSKGGTARISGAWNSVRDIFQRATEPAHAHRNTSADQE